MVVLLFACVVQWALSYFRLHVCREDPTIFGYNLMNEPRSQAELYIIKRQTNDGSKIYNISYNPGDDLQKWIEDMAGYIKSMDPIHLLSTGYFADHKYLCYPASIMTGLGATVFAIYGPFVPCPSWSWPALHVVGMFYLGTSCQLRRCVGTVSAMKAES